MESNTISQDVSDAVVWINDAIRRSVNLDVQRAITGLVAHLPLDTAKTHRVCHHNVLHLMTLPDGIVDQFQHLRVCDRDPILRTEVQLNSDSIVGILSVFAAAYYLNMDLVLTAPFPDKPEVSLEPDAVLAQKLVDLYAKAEEDLKNFARFMLPNGAVLPAVAEIRIFLYGLAQEEFLQRMSMRIVPTTTEDGSVVRNFFSHVYYDISQAPVRQMLAFKHKASTLQGLEKQIRYLRDNSYTILDKSSRLQAVWRTK